MPSGLRRNRQRGCFHHSKATEERPTGTTSATSCLPWPRRSHAISLIRLRSSPANACSTSDAVPVSVARAAAERLGTATVEAADVSPGMIDVARLIQASPTIGWHRVSAEALPFADGDFDWPEKSRELTLKDVSGILPQVAPSWVPPTGAIRFATKTIENGQEVVKDISSDIIENGRKLGIDAIITIGGDGSQTIALDLFNKGVKIVGVPKTIDNDLSATEVTFGFDTALTTATDAIDKIHTTAESHHRIMVVEVMGRDAGWIAFLRGHRWRGACHSDSGNPVHHRTYLRIRRPA